MQNKSKNLNPTTETLDSKQFAMNSVFLSEYNQTKDSFRNVENHNITQST